MTLAKWRFETKQPGKHRLVLKGHEEVGEADRSFRRPNLLYPIGEKPARKRKTT